MLERSLLLLGGLALGLAVVLGRGALWILFRNFF